MHSHNDDIKKLLDDYLPAHYSSEAVTRLKEKGYVASADMVRNARNGRRVSNKATILSVLVEIAREIETAEKGLSNLVNPVS